MLLFFIWSGFFVIMALYWSLLKVIKNDIISIERCWYIVDHLVYSPRMWRSSCISLSIPWVHKVFSTYVEIIPKYLAKFELVSCILHVCGGHPSLGTIFWRSKSYSPRVWRWSFTWLTKKLNSPHMWRLNSCSEKYVL